MGLYFPLTDAGQAERAFVHLSAAFDNLCRNLDRLYYDETCSRPVRRRNLAIGWVDGDESSLEINAKDLR